MRSSPIGAAAGRDHRRRIVRTPGWSVALDSLIGMRFRQQFHARPLTGQAGGRAHRQVLLGHRDRRPVILTGKPPCGAAGSYREQRHLVGIFLSGEEWTPPEVLRVEGVIAVDHVVQAEHVE